MSTLMLIGNSLAVLIAAHELATRGQRVTLLTDGKPLGGHFAGMQINGHSFDAGMVLIEKYTAGGGAPDLRTYDAKRRNDWTRFGELAGSWLDMQVDLRPVTTPKVLVHGRIYPDYLITNRLDALVGAHVTSFAKLPRTDERHAAHKVYAAAYDSLSYAEAAKLNHGEILHESFIEPFVRKLLDVSSNKFLARYHRAAWVPLFYPETLAEVLEGKETSLPEYPFWTSSNGFVGQLVKNLINRLINIPNITLISKPVQSLVNQGGMWSAVVEGGQICFGAKLALGLTPDRAQILLGTSSFEPGQSASVTLLFALVKADAIRQGHGCLMVVDESYATYRLCDQDALAGLETEWHRIVIEANPNHLARMHPTLDPASALNQEMRSLMAIDGEDSVRLLKCINFKNALPLPTAEHVGNMDKAYAEFAEAAEGAILTGNLLGYGVASLNDQIVQGLKISEEFS